MHWRSGGAVLLLSALAASAEDSSVLTKASNESLLWGPYRPNLYFGLRPRIPDSLSTGLLWGRVEDYNKVQYDIRHTCEQQDNMAGYGWDVYDPRIGGVQTIRDRGNGIDVETSFVKFDEGRGGWGARIKGTVRDDAEPGVGSRDNVAETLKTAVYFTVGVGGQSSLEVEGAQQATEFGFDSDVVFSGSTPELGEFKLTITEPDSNVHPVHNHPSYQSKPLDHTLVHSVQVPDEALWQEKGTPTTAIKLSSIVLMLT